jgi:trehalose utilization protein
VLIWWGRLRHDDLPDQRARAIADRVRAGKLGFVALHASCSGKPFRELMGKPCEPAEWHEDGRPERITVEAPEHEIARGVEPFTIPRAAMFVEPFQVPTPETVVFHSKFDGQEPFRSGLTWTVGKGRVAYFRPGHDAFPVLHHPSVKKVIANAARWAAPKKA